MRLLIDGYNVIFTGGLHGTRNTSDALQRARQKLVRLLAQFLTPGQRAATTIVFDAAQAPIADLPDQEVIDGITVLYAVDYPDADTLIESLIAKHSVPRKLLVVSSDHRIQTAASRRKATAIDSDRWLDQLEAGRGLKVDFSTTDADSIGTEKRVPAELSQIDWVEAFSDQVSGAESDKPTDRVDQTDCQQDDELSLGSVDQWTRVFDFDSPEADDQASSKDGN